MKWRFDIWYQSKNIKDVSELMRKLDLGMDGIAYEHKISFSSTKADLSIDEIKKTLIEAYESDGNTVLKIEGGSIS